jgi:ADP-ribosyl-[dinitrogen reductase] hydrolase
VTPRERLEGVLIGTAVGDALGLPLEGLSAQAIARRFTPIDRYQLLGRTGFVSDDTEQSALVAQALAAQPADVEAAVRLFRRSLLGWVLRLPWGIGLATVRACVRIALGLARTGVDSAGNGAAMRAAVVGVAFSGDPALRARFSDAIAQVTHVDARAVEGARFVAEAAARAGAALTPLQALEGSLGVVAQPELRAGLERALALAGAGADVHAAARALGTTGFVLHTVPFAAFCFGRFGERPLEALQQACAPGGDTDSISAIVGAWCGARGGGGAFPPELVSALHDGPFGPTHLRGLAADLAAAREGGARPTTRYSPLAALLRNLALYPVVLAHALRRLLP